MVKLLYRAVPVRLFETGSQPAHIAGRFKNRDLMTGVRQVVGGGHPAYPSSYNRDLHTFGCLSLYLKFLTPLQAFTQEIDRAQHGDRQP